MAKILEIVFIIINTQSCPITLLWKNRASAIKSIDITKIRGDASSLPA